MAGRFRFAEFELDLATYTLRSGGERVRLEKLPMEVLTLLVRSSGALVARGEIQAALWGSDIFVEHDSAINTAVRKIRRALGDDAEKPRFVETVVGKGYRFVASVETFEFCVPANKVDSIPALGRRTFPSYSVTRGAQEFIVGTGVTLLGRDPAVGVYVEHPSVSRHHARISITAEGAVLEDLKSRNGTFLDGQRIDVATRIRSGAIIGLGPITLTFRVLSAPASTRPAAPE
jgi:DNA-binding winged helix-turn-helix (wHTH) protein